MQFFKILFILFISIFLTFPAVAAGSSSNDNKVSDNSKANSYFKLAKVAIKQAKKYQKKGKKEKSINKFNFALDNLIKADKVDPNNADILNLLGFSYRKTGDFIMAEIYYKQGLEINPTHKGINEYLGELYVQTGRSDLANERLKVLENCNCEEYGELKEIIAGTKESKY